MKKIFAIALVFCSFLIYASYSLYKKAKIADKLRQYKPRENNLRGNDTILVYDSSMYIPKSKDTLELN